MGDTPRACEVLVLVVVVSFLLTSSVSLEPNAVVSGDAREAEASCDMCMCTRSIPPQCRCTDMKPYCLSSCKSCICTRSFLPQCHCSDIKDHCD